MEKLILDGGHLTLEDIHTVSYADHVKVSLCDKAVEKVQKSSQYIQSIIKTSGKTVYGVNTGFGALSNKKIQ